MSMNPWPHHRTAVQPCALSIMVNTFQRSGRLWASQTWLGAAQQEGREHPGMSMVKGTTSSFQPAPGGQEKGWLMQAVAVPW